MIQDSVSHRTDAGGEDRLAMRRINDIHLLKSDV